jgi:FkbM family methyltransferase
MARGWSSRRRFDIVELCVAVVFMAAITVSATVAVIAAVTSYFVSKAVPDEPEAMRLARVYGTFHYSLGLEETIIRDFFQDRRGGFFVDIGAGDYKADSNTFYLEKQLGWSGIAVDALASYAPGYAQHRPATRFFAFFVSDTSNKEATVYVPHDTRQTADWKRPEYGPASEAHVQTITLTQLLSEQRVSRIDLLSVDVELAEPRVLAGFDIDRFRPSLVCIEAFAPVRQQVLDYFARHGYVVVGRYLGADQRNLYFTPIS